MLKTLLVAGLALVGYVQGITFSFLQYWPLAIAFTSNVTGATLTKGSVFEVDWSSVDTDPTTLSIYLWNFVQWPPLTYQLALDGITAWRMYLTTSSHSQRQGICSNSMWRPIWVITPESKHADNTAVEDTNSVLSMEPTHTSSMLRPVSSP